MYSSDRYRHMKNKDGCLCILYLMNACIFIFCPSNPIPASSKVPHVGDNYILLNKEIFINKSIGLTFQGYQVNSLLPNFLLT